MIVEQLQGLAHPLKKLKLLPGNPRKGDVEAVKRSYERFGQRKPIVARPDGTVIAGNHQFLAAKALGWDEMAVVFVDDDDQTAKAFALADNRTSDLGSYDSDALAELLADVAVDPELLLATGYTQADLDALIGEIEELPPVVGDPDEVPESAPAKTIKGDVWLLGPHRLMCGDSTVPTDVERLMNGEKVDAIYTDPPYGMNLDTDYSSMPGGKKHRPVLNDDQDFDASVFMEMFHDIEEQFWWGADYYRQTIARGGSWIVWDKHNGEGGGQYDDLFGSSFELCWSKKQHKRKIERYTWATSHGRTDADAGYIHPTQKPVTLVSNMLEKYCPSASLILDLFGGSGTTLIAAHGLGRIAYLMELDERYCDIICKRWEQATGITPIHEATKREHSFLD
jgi:DNA modification methylase